MGRKLRDTNRRRAISLEVQFRIKKISSFTSPKYSRTTSTYPSFRIHPHSYSIMQQDPQGFIKPFCTNRIDIGFYLFVFELIMSIQTTTPSQTKRIHEKLM